MIPEPVAQVCATFLREAPAGLVTASRPKKASFFQPTAHESPASTGLVSRLMSWPCSG